MVRRSLVVGLAVAVCSQACGSIVGLDGLGGGGGGGGGGGWGGGFRPPLCVPPTTFTVIPAQDTVEAGRATVLRVVSDSMFYCGGQWSSSDTTVASVSTAAVVYASTAVVVGVAPGTATIPLVIQGRDGSPSSTATARIQVRPATSTFVTVAAGSDACAIASDGGTYCWGAIALTSVPSRLRDSVQFTSLSFGRYRVCGLTAAGAAYCWGSIWVGPPPIYVYGVPHAEPVAVAGGLVFASLVAGTQDHMCGVTTAGAAYCWGDNGDGQLGTGTSGDGLHPDPVAVTGDHVFASVTAGYGHSCGVTTDGAAYCWGLRSLDQLGDGSTAVASDYARPTPLPVAGGIRFSSLAAGYGHTCGISTDGAAYCWGWNIWGQLGTGDTVASRVPTKVAGGLTFRTIGAAENYTCGITRSGDAYCWGTYGGYPAIVNLAPTKVEFGHQWRSLSVGGTYTCGIADDAIAYCWGGGGAAEVSLVPQRVPGQP